MPNPPYIQNPQCLPLRKPIASVDESIEEDNSSCVIGWESQTREVKQELLNNKIEEKRSQRSNYHRKLKRLQVGDIVTAKVGKSYKKPNGKNTLRMPMFGKIIKSMSNNEYDVEFVNNTTKTLKSSQLSYISNLLKMNHMLLHPHCRSSTITTLLLVMMVLLSTSSAMKMTRET